MPRYRVRRFRNPFRYLPDSVVIALAIVLLALVVLAVLL